MNTKERFLGVFNYQPVDRVPDLEFGYWEETLEQWHKEGLPDNIQDNWTAERYFGFDFYKEASVSLGLIPSFEKKVIEERGEHQIIQDENGSICEVKKVGASIPRYIKLPIETREDWEVFKEKLNPDEPKRYPDNWEELKSEWKNRDYPLAIHCGSLYGWLRGWMGVENISLALALQPDWVEEMMEYITNYILKVIDRALEEVDFDFAFWWEDMCFNKGPLISPTMFKEFMVPRYKRITARLREKGIDLNILDCDGDIEKLVPLWLEAGINVMFPLEAAHTHIEKLKDIYGKDLRLMGGVNKLALITGTEEAIDREIERVGRLLSRGGYIPHIDHRVSPDISLKNYHYYIKRKRELLGL